MKKIFTILILAFFISSCSKNEYEQKLIGNWNNFPTFGMTDLKLYRDSVISYEYYVKRKGTWKATNSQIKFHFPKKNPGSHVNLTLDYKLKNDSLLIKNTKDSIYRMPVLLRVNNVWNHYLKEIDLQIDLPKADFKLTRNDSMYYGIDLYVGLKDNKIKIKNFRKELDLKKDLYNVVFSEMAQHKKSEEKNLYFNLIIDKNITEKKVDSIKQILKQFPTNMRIFRVYKNDSADYGKYDLSGQGEIWNWYGRYE